MRPPISMPVSYHLSPASLTRSLYLYACDRLYHEFAWTYDAVSLAVSLGAWPAWRRVVLADVAPRNRASTPRNRVSPRNSVSSFSSSRNRASSSRNRVSPRNSVSSFSDCGPPPDRILELGFGTGALLAELAATGAEVWGLDASPAMHRQAARRLRALGLALPRVQAPAQAMPFADAAFSAVVATFPAPYILEPATLAECRRVLGAGGRLVIGGLWVTLRARRGLNRLGIFYNAPAAAPAPMPAEAVLRRLDAAGFAARLEMRASGWADVAVVVGEKRDEPCRPGG